jgi:hypothetical protein
LDESYKFSTQIESPLLKYALDTSLNVTDGQTDFDIQQNFQTYSKLYYQQLKNKLSLIHSWATNLVESGFIFYDYKSMMSYLDPGEVYYSSFLFCLNNQDNDKVEIKTKYPNQIEKLNQEFMRIQILLLDDSFSSGDRLFNRYLIDILNNLDRDVCTLAIKGIFNEKSSQRLLDCLPQKIRNQFQVYADKHYEELLPYRDEAFSILWSIIWGRNYPSLATFEPNSDIAINAHLQPVVDNGSLTIEQQEFYELKESFEESGITYISSHEYRVLFAIWYFEGILENKLVIKYKWVKRLYNDAAYIFEKRGYDIWDDIINISADTPKYPFLLQITRQKLQQRLVSSVKQILYKFHPYSYKTLTLMGVEKEKNLIRYLRYSSLEGIQIQFRRLLLKILEQPEYLLGNIKWYFSEIPFYVSSLYINVTNTIYRLPEFKS